MEPCLRREVLSPRQSVGDPCVPDASVGDRDEAVRQARASITCTVWMLLVITSLLATLTRFWELS